MTKTLFLWVVVYQIKDPNRQNRVREILHFNGQRIRSCVYETVTGETGIKRLLEEICLELREEDEVRVYRVCETCRAQSRLFGDIELSQPNAAIII